MLCNFCTDIDLYVPDLLFGSCLSTHASARGLDESTYDVCDTCTLIRGSQIERKRIHNCLILNWIVHFFAEVGTTMTRMDQYEYLRPEIIIFTRAESLLDDPVSTSI